MIGFAGRGFYRQGTGNILGDLEMGFFPDWEDGREMG